MGDYYRQLIFHSGFGLFTLGVISIYKGQWLGYAGLIIGLVAIFIGIKLLRKSDDD